MKIEIMSVTKARNDFFRIVKRSYLKKEAFLIEKGGIPLSYILTADIDGIEKLTKKRDGKE